MNRTAWGLTFVVTASAAAGLLVATVRRWEQPAGAAPAVVRRDPRTLSDVELNLILNKIREGDVLAIRGDIPAARRAWSEARRQGEGVWQIHEGIADSLARVALREEALEEYLVADRLVPPEFSEMRSGIWSKRAALVADAGRHEEAFELLLETGELRTLMNLSEKGRDRGRMLAKARERAQTTDARLFALVSAISRKEGAKLEAARALARYARAVVPWDAAVNRQAVAELRAEKKHAEAVDVCRAWVKAEPQNLEAYRLMGDLWLEAGDEKKAVLAYTSIVDVRPGDADAHRELGQAFLSMKRLSEAIVQFEKSKQLRPEEPARWIDLAETTALCDPAEGEKRFDEIAKKTWEPRFGSVVGQIKQRQAVRFIRELETARKSGDSTRAKELRRILASYDVPEGAYDLMFVMTWDTQTDIDMEVIDPSGEHVDHGHPGSKAGGKYWVDNTSGHGPETFTQATVPSGTFRIGAHYHSGSGRTTVQFAVVLYEDTDRELRQEHTLVLEKSGEQKFIADVAVR